MTTVTSFKPDYLTVDSLTGGEKTGSGIFDELMRSIKSHLAEEYKHGRITGDQYTKAYISAVETALAQGSGYLLQHQITNQNIRLLDQQILAAEKNVDLVQKQIEKMTAEIALLNAQTITEGKRQDIMDQELVNLGKQALLIDEQITNAQKDALIKDEQVLQMTAQTALIGQQEANAQAENAVITNTADKVLAETAVLEQKRITEEYQTRDTVGGNVAEGVIGKQMALYENQAEGYIRDAEQKAAKIFMDSFNTRTSIESLNENETLDATVTGVQIKDVLNKVREGVNVTTQP